MSTGVNTGDNTIGDLVSYGITTPPTLTIPRPPEGADYFVTSDGTPSGNVSEQWKYDSEEDVWIQAPVGGSSTCPAPMSRSVLRSLRGAGNLLKDCHYIITDYNRATVGAATILLHAVDENTLSMDVHVKTTFDNIAWDGRYDIDTNRIEELKDNRGNNVTGGEIVDTFPWGNVSLSDNIIDEGATFTYIDGIFNDNKIRTGAIVVANNTGAGSFLRNVIGEGSSVTWAAGDFRENAIGTNATVIHASTGDFDNNTVDSLSSVNTSGVCNVNQVHISSNSTLTISGGNLSRSSIMGESNVTLIGASNYDITIDGSSVVTQDGTGYIRGTSLTANSTLTFGNVNILDNEFVGSIMNARGSSGNVRYCSFRRTTMNLINIPSLTLDYNDFGAFSQMACNSALRTYVRFTTMSGFGRILQSVGTQLDMNYNGLRDYGYVQVTNGRLYSDHNSVSNLSYIQQGTAGINRVERTSISSQSHVRFIAQATGCRVYYCDISSFSNIYHMGTSTDCFFYYCQVSSGSSMYSSGSRSLRAYYNAATGNSVYYSINVSATHYAYYNVMSAHSFIRHIDSTGGRIYAVHCHGQGLMQLQGSTAAGQIHNSSFTAYYYLFANNWTVTRTSLHGYGRRSYEVTNPPANGTFTQNF